MKKYLYIALAALGMMGCEEELDRVSSGSGFLISLGETSVEVTTKAASEDFRLVVTKDGISEPAYEGDLTSGDTRFVPVSAGTYEIKATSKSWTDNTLISPNPYYAADTTDVEITEGDAQKTITLTAKYGCALASVVFPEAEEMAKVFKNYYVKVQVGGSSMKLSSADTKAYFKANTEVSFYFGGTKQNGEEVEEKQLTSDQLPSTFNAADYCKITLQMNDNLLIDIAKVEEKTVGITEEIPLDWLPKPKVVAEGFDDNNTLTFVETEAKTPKLNLELSHALQDIRFKFNFQDEQFADLLQADKEYLLSTDKETIEQVLGISLPSIGSESASIDFAPLVAKLQTNADTSTTNTMTIVPKANNRWSSEESQVVVDSVYTFVCNKPEFTVAVQPGNCWSREFTVDEVTVSGNADAEKIKSNLVYQYYDGTNWVECKTRDNVAGRTQQFAAVAEDITTKDYKVRALYRGAIASAEVDAKLEIPEQLPNSGFEDWYEEDQSDHKNLWFPYAQSATGPQWTTNNLETTHSSSDAWDSPSAVKRTTVKNTGNYAAWIRTVGHGNGNNNAGVTWPNIEWAITGTPTKGILSYDGEFTSRPSHVSFYYRYIQKGDDAGVVELKVENKEQNEVLYATSFTVTNTNYIKREIPIEYLINNIPATHVTLTFRSGSKHDEVVSAKARGNNVDGTEANEHYGSEFFVDDISLTYEK